MHRQEGQVLIMALIALALGALLVTPLLGQASTSLLASGLLHPQLIRSASCEAGVVDGMYKLRYTGLADSVTELNPTYTYTITVNGVPVLVTVSWVPPTAEATPTPPCEEPQCQRVQVSKEADPEVITPGVPTTVTYTITIKNVGTSTIYILNIGDRLPEDFTYEEGSANLTSECDDIIPLPTPVIGSDGSRQTVQWEWTMGTKIRTDAPDVPCPTPENAGPDTFYLTFQATIENPQQTTYDDLGWATFVPDSIGIVTTSGTDGSVTSTWPRYEIEASYGGMTITARVNLLRIEDVITGISVVSWHID